MENSPPFSLSVYVHEGTEVASRRKKRREKHQVK
jgi:hypothetical protein